MIVLGEGQPVRNKLCDKVECCKYGLTLEVKKKKKLVCEGW
jgi:hypothetical protein